MLRARLRASTQLGVRQQIRRPQAKSINSGQPGRILCFVGGKHERRKTWPLLGNERGRRVSLGQAANGKLAASVIQLTTGVALAGERERARAQGDGLCVGEPVGRRAQSKGASENSFGIIICTDRPRSSRPAPLEAGARRASPRPPAARSARSIKLEFGKRARERARGFTEFASGRQRSKGIESAL